MPLCFEWIQIASHATKHQNTCVKATGTKMMIGEACVNSAVIVGNILPTASKQLISQVFPIMTNDNLSKIAQEDPLIVGLGNFWLRENIGN
jgi:hypothetical protein